MNSETVEKLLFLALGWLLGLLAPVISDANKRRRENKLGRVAIYSELRDVSHKLALATHYIHMHQGTVDRPHLEWIQRHLEGYAGLIATNNLTKSIRLQLSWSEEQLKQYVTATASSERKSVVLQKYPVPMLDSRVSAMWSFDTIVQRRILDIRTRIELLNEIVERSRKYSDMTFGKLEGDNYRLVVEIVEQCYSEYAKSAELIVDQVQALKHLL